MHIDAYNAVASLRPAVATHVYEVGSLDINGSVRSLFGDAVHYFGIDRVAGAGVDKVADGLTFTPPFEPDCIVCCEVLEHSEDAQGLVNRLAQVLRRGGTLVVTCAGPARLPHSAVDGGALREGEHYENIAPETLRDWLCGCFVKNSACYFKQVDVTTGPGVEHSRAPGAGEAGDVYARAVKS